MNGYIKVDIEWQMKMKITHWRKFGSYILLDNNEIWFISNYGHSEFIHKESKEMIDIDVNNYAIIILFSNGEYKTILNANVYSEPPPI